MNAMECLEGMMKADMTLYEKILDTSGFAFCFNKLVKLAGAQQPADEDIEALTSSEDAMAAGILNANVKVEFEVCGKETK